MSQQWIQQQCGKLDRTCLVPVQLVRSSLQKAIQFGTARHYAYFHSVIKYGIILGDNPSNNRKIFTLNKKTVRIMAGAQTRTSCRSPFPQLEILPVSCQYTLSLMNFIIINQAIFQTNSFIHNIHTRNKHHLHTPQANLPHLQKSTLYVGIKIFNTLWPSVTILKNDKAKLKAALQKYLQTHSFYSVDKFFMFKDDL